MKRWIALIPAYDPGQTLLTLLEEMQQFAFGIVVVNDGSSESFSSVFRQAAQYAVVLAHPANRGKGRALKTGMEYIQKHSTGGEIVVTVDADGQHRAADAARLCQAAEKMPDALILGSRKLRDHVPLRSQFGNTMTRLVYRLSTGLQVHDTQTGLRAFSACLLPELAAISGERYEYEMNVLLECARRKIPIQEIEIETIYMDGNSSSHFHALRDSCLIYREIFKFSISSLASFLIDYTLYSLFLALTGKLGWAAGLQISNIGARIISAGVNYTMNRRLVFRSQAKVASSLLQYAVLAAVILAGNTLALSLLVGWGVHQMAAKLCVEALFFLLSWAVQRKVIFTKRPKGEE